MAHPFPWWCPDYCEICFEDCFDYLNRRYQQGLQAQPTGESSTEQAAAEAKHAAIQAALRAAAEAMKLYLSFGGLYNTKLTESARSKLMTTRAEGLITAVKQLHSDLVQQPCNETESNVERCVRYKQAYSAVFERWSGVPLPDLFTPYTTGDGIDREATAALIVTFAQCPKLRPDPDAGELWYSRGVDGPACNHRSEMLELQRVLLTGVDPQTRAGAVFLHFDLLPLCLSSLHLADGITAETGQMLLGIEAATETPCDTAGWRSIHCAYAMTLLCCASSMAGTAPSALIAVGSYSSRCLLDTTALSSAPPVLAAALADVALLSQMRTYTLLHSAAIHHVLAAQRRANVAAALREPLERSLRRYVHDSYCAAAYSISKHVFEGLQIAAGAGVQAAELAAITAARDLTGCRAISKGLLLTLVAGSAEEMDQVLRRQRCAQAWQQRKLL